MLIRQNSYPDNAYAGCLLCGNPYRVDQIGAVITQIEIPRVGRVCICDRCVADMAALFGLEAPVEDTESLDLEESEARVHKLEAKLATLRAVLYDDVE